MMRFKALDLPTEWEWVKLRAHPICCEDSQGVVAYDENCVISAVCVADSFTADACNVHLAIGNPLVIRGGFLQEVARHLFVTCNRKRIFGLVPANNKKALQFNAHLGWKVVTRVPDGFAEGVDYVVMRMDRDTCRWLVKMREAA